MRQAEQYFSYWANDFPVCSLTRIAVRLRTVSPLWREQRRDQGNERSETGEGCSAEHVANTGHGAWRSRQLALENALDPGKKWGLGLSGEVGWPGWLQREGEYVCSGSSLGKAGPFWQHMWKVFFFFLIFLLFFELEDSCFTMFWWSLPYINVDQS